MSWSPQAKKDAFVILGLILPALMLGLGLGSYFLSTAIGLRAYSILISLAGATIGLIISLLLTLRIGRKFETKESTM
jgi:hypothetical protein